MTNRAIRAILLLLALGAAGAAGYSIFHLERRAAGERLAQQLLRERVKTILASLSEVRASQRSYVALGQGHEFWTARVTNLLNGLDANLRDLRGMLRSPTAGAALDAAAVALENFRKLDARAQEYVSLNQSVLASDLIFSDGLEMTGTASSQIDAALTDELAAHEAVLWMLHRQQAWMAAGIGGFVLLILLLLTPVPRRAPVLQPGKVEAASTAPAPQKPAAAAVQNPSPPIRPTKQLDLPAAARLCTEFGRVMETREVPPLLARAAEILDAAGLVIWVSDRAAVELRPVLTHGYSDKLVAQMRSIPRDAQNAAALAFRSAQPRIVAGTEMTNGAVVVPLITPAGCVGVLAAELRAGGEQRESTRALATILAAQLATLVGAAPSAGAAHAQA